VKSASPNAVQERSLVMVIALAMLALLMASAWCDIATRTIPDSFGLLLLALGGFARALEGPAALALSAATALTLFLLLLAAYSRGLLGGGDVKIITAMAIGLSPLDSYRFVVATAIAGGVLGVLYLMLSQRLRTRHRTPRSETRRSLLGRVAAIESWRIRRRGSLPYGVAIAVGGAFVLLRSGSS
jgi:prepilin peptidase CpaA